MSQHDMNIANQGFPAFRSDLNNALTALASNSSGDTPPSTTYANQFWYETDTNTLYFRNEDNDAWITLAFFDQTNDEWEIRSAVIQAVDSAGVVIKTDDGTTRLTVADSGAVSINTSLDVDNIKIDGNTISSTDTNGNITLDPNGTGDINLSADVDVNGTITSDGADLDGAVVINESGADVDFRVESDTVTNALFVEGSSGNVGIGTSSPSSDVGVSRLLEIGGSSASGLKVSTPSGAKIEIYAAPTLAYVENTTNHPMSFRINNTERMRLDTSGNLQFNSGYGSVATAYGCRAWVNFDGTGTPASNGSGNVSSISDIGVGIYEVNFTSSMPDVNYCVSATSVNQTTLCHEGGADLTTSKVRVTLRNISGVNLDLDESCVAIFR
jgi:hypothetical protein